MLTSLPSHLVEVLGSGDGTHNFGDNSGGMYCYLYFPVIVKLCLSLCLCCGSFGGKGGTFYALICKNICTMHNKITLYSKYFEDRVGIIPT